RMARRAPRGARRRDRRRRRRRSGRRSLLHARPAPAAARVLGALGEGGRVTIPIKSKEGIAKMREVCAIAATVLEQLKPLVRPGFATQDLEEAGRDFIAQLGARSACYGY